MPCVSANFCDDGFDWVEDVIKDGGALWYLCSARWHGTCTSGRGEHSFYCARHFNRRRFAVPLEHHVRAIRRFNAQNDRMDKCGEVKAYARAMCASYGPGDIVNFLERFREGGNVLVDAVRAVFSGMGMPADFQMTSRQLLSSSLVPVFPRAWLPSTASELVDHAEASGSVMIASVYLGWLKGWNLIHPADFPGLSCAIDAVLCRLPPELAALVTRHLYGVTRLGPPEI